MHAFDSYVHDIATRHAEYEALLADKTAKIRQTEAENLKLGKKKVRFSLFAQNSSNESLLSPRSGRLET